MQLWRRKSMQWVEAPMENSLNLLSVMTLGLSSGQQSVLWKREGEWKWKGGTKLLYTAAFNILMRGSCPFFDGSLKMAVRGPTNFTMCLFELWWPVVNMWLSKDKHPSNKYGFCRNALLMLQLMLPWCKMKTRNCSSIGSSDFDQRYFAVLFFYMVWIKCLKFMFMTHFILLNICVYINKNNCKKWRKFKRICEMVLVCCIYLFFLIWILRFGAVACGVASELYVFGGVRSRDDSQASEMVTCKSEFYHDEFKR